MACGTACASCARCLPWRGAPLAAERWPDPDRTLKRYGAEVMELTLLDWQDNLFLDPAARDARGARSREEWENDAK